MPELGVYVLRRLAHAVFVVLAVLVVVFLIVHATGDPAALALGADSTREQVEEFRREKGFDQPLPVQFARYLRGVVAGDFGESLRYNAPALPLVLERIPATLELTLAAMLVAVGVGVPCGIVSALRRNTVTDVAVRLVALVGQSAPVFWLGIMLVFVFAMKFRVLPSSGREDGVWSLVLPAVALSSYSMASIARLLRAGILDVMRQDYIRTARAKGLRAASVVGKHMLRNSLLPVVTMVGLQFGTLLGGAVITETIFAWPGLGRLVIQAIQNRDVFLVQASVCVIAVLFIVVNLLIDVLYTVLDPRIRLA